MNEQKLSEQIDSLLEHGLGKRLEFVCVVKGPEGLGIFTNCETEGIVDLLTSGLLAVNPD